MHRHDCRRLIGDGGTRTSGAYEEGSPLARHGVVAIALLSRRFRNSIVYSKIMKS